MGAWRTSGRGKPVIPIGAAARASARLIQHATLRVYPGGPHGLADTHKEQIKPDLLSFLRS
jgi:non-heme chloroperoxidase